MALTIFLPLLLFRQNYHSEAIHLTTLQTRSRRQHAKTLNECGPNDSDSFRNQVMEHRQCIFPPEEDDRVGLTQFEDHAVDTPAGYVLHLHRLANPGKPPILMLSGLYDTSFSWLLGGNGGSLAFFLHSRGFDVWLGNWRSSRFGCEYYSSQTNMGKYWNWTFTDAGRQDLPKMVSHILNSSASSKLILVGHSAAATMMAAGLTDPANGEALQKSISLVVMLSPALDALGVKGAVTMVAKFRGALEWLHPHSSSGIKPHSWLSHCRYHELCDSILDLFDGHSSLHAEQSRMCRWNWYPSYSGVSLKAFVHLVQNANPPSILKEFDYGEQGNRLHYGQPTAPSVHLDRINVPMALLHGANDLIFGATESIADLTSALNASYVIYNKRYANYAHSSWFTLDRQKDLHWYGLDVEELVRTYAAPFKEELVKTHAAPIKRIRQD